MYDPASSASVLPALPPRPSDAALPGGRASGVESPSSRITGPLPTGMMAHGAVFAQDAGDRPVATSDIVTEDPGDPAPLPDAAEPGKADDADGHVAEPDGASGPEGGHRTDGQPAAAQEDQKTIPTRSDTFRYSSEQDRSAPQAASNGPASATGDSAPAPGSAGAAAPDPAPAVADPQSGSHQADMAYAPVLEVVGRHGPTLIGFAGILPGDLPRLIFPVGSDEIDLEVASNGYAVWQDGGAFYMGLIDMQTGMIAETLTRIPGNPLEFNYFFQGPEIMVTPTAVTAVATSEEGLIIYDEFGASELIPGTAGYRHYFTSKEESPVLRFTGVDDTGGRFLYDDGVISTLPLPGLIIPWISSTELLFGGFGEAYGLYDVETGEVTPVTDRAYAASSSQSAGYTAPDGSRYVVVYDNRTSDLYVETDEEWVFDRTLSSPYEGFSDLWSVEFFEWQDRTWFIGYWRETGSDFNTSTIIVIYDLETRDWVPLKSGGVGGIDPEVLPLDNGDLAFYFSRLSQQGVATVSPEQVLTPPAMALSFAFGRYNELVDLDGPDGSTPFADLVAGAETEAVDARLTTAEALGNGFSIFDIGSVGQTGAPVVVTKEHGLGIGLDRTIGPGDVISIALKDSFGFGRASGGEVQFGQDPGLINGTLDPGEVVIVQLYMNGTFVHGGVIEAGAAQVDAFDLRDVAGYEGQDFDELRMGPGNATTNFTLQDIIFDRVTVDPVPDYLIA